MKALKISNIILNVLALLVFFFIAYVYISVVVDHIHSVREGGNGLTVFAVILVWITTCGFGSAIELAIAIIALIIAIVFFVKAKHSFEYKKQSKVILILSILNTALPIIAFFVDLAILATLNTLA